MRDGDVLRPVARIDAVGVAREALRRVDLQAPHREAIAAVIHNVEVGRVFQGDAVKREVTRVVGDNQARNLLASARARLFGQVPPGILRPQHFFPATAVDYAVPHDCRSGCMIDRDQWLATARTGAMAHDPATARRHGVECRIPRRVERHTEPDDQSHVGAQFQRTAQKCAIGLVHVQQYGTPFAALIDGFLNAGRVELLLVGRREGAAAGLQLGVELGAKLREKRLNYGARVLCEEDVSLTERQEREERESAIQVGCSSKGLKGRNRSAQVFRIIRHPEGLSLRLRANTAWSPKTGTEGRDRTRGRWKQAQCSGAASASMFPPKCGSNAASISSSVENCDTGSSSKAIDVLIMMLLPSTCNTCSRVAEVTRANSRRTAPSGIFRRITAIRTCLPQWKNRSSERKDCVRNWAALHR